MCLEWRRLLLASNVGSCVRHVTVSWIGSIVIGVVRCLDCFHLLVVTTATPKIILSSD
jgi:hypothetical protein